MSVSGRWWVVVGVLVVAGCEQKTEDVCAGVECENGRCAALGGEPACVCDDGFETREGRCVRAVPRSPCASRPCAALPDSVCVFDGTASRCECPDTRIEVNGSCVLRSACNPNPCAGEHQTVCVEWAGVARCLCDDGHAPDGGVCTPSPEWNCDTIHTGDSAEPDECPARAVRLLPGMNVSRTLSPAGDQDWFRLTVQPGAVYSFVANGSVPLIIEVQSPDGAPVAGDIRGAVAARVEFLAPPAFTEALVRVRALSATTTDNYTARYSEAGADDYANDEASALTLSTAGPGFTGQLQYAGDIDVVRLQVPALTSVELWSDGGVARFELTRADGGTRILDRGRTNLTVSGSARVLLAARARDERSTGPFRISFRELGEDDHSEDVLFGTTLTPDATPVQGLIEREGDVDSFVLAQQVNHIYQVTTNGASGLQLHVVDSYGTIASSGSWYDSPTWKGSSAEVAYLQVSSWFLGGGAAMAYQMRVAELGVDDHGDTTASATAATLGTPTSGRLEYRNDVDVFSVNVATAGHVLLATAPASMSVELLDGSGAVVATGNGRSAIRTTVAGPHYVSIKGTYNNTWPAAYSVTIEDDGVDDHDATMPTAAQVATPVTGSVQFSGDVDAFTFAAQARHVYRVTCTVTGGGTCPLSGSDGAGNSATGSSGNLMSLMAPLAGTWRIEVTSSYSTQVPMDYALMIIDLGLEDHSENAVLATPMTVGTPVTGSLSWTDDVDVFSFDAVAGHIYSVNVTGESPQLAVKRQSGAQIAQRYNEVSFVAAASETMTVWLSRASTGAGYTVTLADTGADDHGNSGLTGTPVSTPSATTTVIQYVDDADVLVLPVSSQRFYSLSNTPSCTVTVSTPNGITINVSGNSSNRSFKPPPGTTQVWLTVSAYSVPSTCVVTVLEGELDDHGDTVSTATPLTLNADAGVAGTIQSQSDIDAFSFTLASQDIVQLETMAPSSSCALDVTNPLGVTLTSLDCGGSFRATMAGTWTVLVRPYISQIPIAYSLRARTLVDDVGDTTATASPLMLGTQFTGAMQHQADLDVFSVTLTAGTTYQLTLQGAVQARLTTASGAFVNMYYPSGTTSPVTVASSGTYFLTLSASFSSNPDAYLVRLQ